MVITEKRGMRKGGGGGDIIISPEVLSAHLYYIRIWIPAAGGLCHSQPQGLGVEEEKVQIINSDAALKYMAAYLCTRATLWI